MQRAIWLASVATGVTAMGCAAPHGPAASTIPVAAEPTYEVPADLRSAALPSSMLDARTGRQLDAETVQGILASARAVCVGEEHPNPHDHWAQLRIVEQLAELVHARGGELALGMEMFQRPMQGVLDDYAASRIDEPTLLSRAAWDERWGYDFGLYRQTINAARAAGATLLALNAERELTKQVARGGLDALSTADRALVPELVLDDVRHRAWWDAIMASMGGGGHGHGGGSTVGEPMSEDSSDDAAALAGPPIDPIYTVQVIWDETMADGAARWLAASSNRTIVILAGTGHCHDSGIVGRLLRRGVAATLSIRPVVDLDGAVATALVERQNDLLWVMTPPSQPSSRAPSE